MNRTTHSVSTFLIACLVLGGGHAAFCEDSAEKGIKDTMTSAFRREAGENASSKIEQRSATAKYLNLGKLVGLRQALYHEISDRVNVQVEMLSKIPVTPFTNVQQDAPTLEQLIMSIEQEIVALKDIHGMINWQIKEEKQTNE